MSHHFSKQNGEQDLGVMENKLQIEFLLCHRQNQTLELQKDILTVGSGKHCDIRFAKNEGVAKNHCSLQFEDNQWKLTTSGDHPVWLNDRRVNGSATVNPSSIVFLGKLMGPGFRIRSPETGAHAEPLLAYSLRDIRSSHTSMMAIAAKAATEKPFQRRVLKRWFNRLDRKHKRRLRQVAGSLVILLLLTSGVIYYQQLRLSRLHSLAEDIFYRMKGIELQISRTEQIIEATGDSSGLEQKEKLWTQFSQMEKQYDGYLRELGFGAETMPEDERIILRMARVFGECELNAPKEFVRQVRAYINKWRTTPRFREAITQALKSGYVQFIAKTMLKYHLPPHFMYLAMQESDFDPYRCGPRTRYGIAKGMWQFIPATAVYFGLKLGPLVEVRRPDPKDERHNFRKSTVAAAKYINFLYTTEAQASGLLVMASYNWGETKVRRLINQLPENPRARNFWSLMKKYKLPRETRDYVFYIFSAAVIGENPKLFGFDLQNPLASAVNEEKDGA